MSGAREVSKKKLWTISAYAAIAAVAGIFLGEPLRLTERPSEFIGLLFSILAASIFAVVSIVGDPSMLLPGNRRVAWESAIAIQVQIQRLNVLFSLQIITLGLLVVTEIIKALSWESFYWLFNVLAALTTFCFLLSLSLPFELGSIQKARLRREVEARKNS